MPDSQTTTTPPKSSGGDATQLKPGIISAEIAWVIVATSFAFVVGQLDVTIVNVALPRISVAIEASLSSLQWVVDAYALAFAVLLVSAGVLGDRFGSRRVYLIGFAVFALASLGCGLAPNAAVLIGSRAVQGIGAALMVPSSLALLNHATAHDKALRARSVGLWTAAGGISIAAGPVVGGVLLHAFDWRSIFLVNLPLCVIGVALTLRAIPRSEPGSKQRALDPLGQILSVLALIGLTGGVIEVRELGLFHPLVIGGFVCAVVAGFAFVAAESRAESPMLPLRFFALQNFSACVAYGTIMNLTYYGVIFVLTLYLQQVHGYSPIEAGIAYIPLTATFILSNLISGRLGSRMGPRVPMVIGGVIGAVGFVLLSFFTNETSYWAMLPAFLIIPGGMGLGVPAMTTAILSSVERSWSGTVSAVLNAARQAGGAIGVAAFGALSGGGTEHVTPGLRTSAMIAIVLLALSAALAWFFIREVPHRDVETAAAQPGK